MFVNVVEFPVVVEGGDREFRAWFEWSNAIDAPVDGFVSRRLLEDTKAPGRYAAIVEHEIEATSMAMHASDAQEQVWTQVEPLPTGSPTTHLSTGVSRTRQTSSPGSPTTERGDGHAPALRFT